MRGPPDRIWNEDPSPGRGKRRTTRRSLPRREWPVVAGRPARPPGLRRSADAVRDRRHRRRPAGPGGPRVRGRGRGLGRRVHLRRDRHRRRATCTTRGSCSRRWRCGPSGSGSGRSCSRRARRRPWKLAREAMTRRPAVGRAARAAGRPRRARRPGVRQRRRGDGRTRPRRAARRDARDPRRPVVRRAVRVRRATTTGSSR